MAKRPLNLRLTGATVLREGVLQTAPVALRDGQFSTGAPRSVDLRGYYILPGIIDLHGCMAARRRVSPVHALKAIDREAAANGVTLAWLSQGWSWEGGCHGPDFAETLMAALAGYAPRMQTDLRIQLRCETHTVDTAGRLLDAVRRYGIGYVMFSNRLEDARSPAHAPGAGSAGRTPERQMAVIREARMQGPLVPRHLCRLSAEFDRLGVIYGSHEDPNAETRETFSMIGAKICEYPAALTAAKLARAVGDPVIVGAHDVIRAGPDTGTGLTDALIDGGYCDALVSGDSYALLARAAFALADRGVMPLPRSWAMISANPARILRLRNRGAIIEGARADLTIVNARTRAVEATIVAGRITYLAGDAERRFLAGAGALSLAAE